MVVRTVEFLKHHSSVYVWTGFTYFWFQKIKDLISNVLVPYKIKINQTNIITVLQLVMHALSHYLMKTMTCDVIWENPAYEGANSAFLDQPLPYVYIHKLFLNCAEIEKGVFCRCHAECAVSSQSMFFLFFHKPGFPYIHIMTLFFIHVCTSKFRKFELAPYFM